MRRKLAVVVPLVILIFLYTTGYVPVSQFFQSHLKATWEGRYNLDRQNQTILFQWIPGESADFRIHEDKEIIFKGAMYDIVSIEISGDTIIYHTWYDHEESTLSTDLHSEEELVSSSDPFKINYLCQFDHPAIVIPDPNLKPACEVNNFDVWPADQLSPPPENAVQSTLDKLQMRFSFS